MIKNQRPPFLEAYQRQEEIEKKCKTGMTYIDVFKILGCKQPTTEKEWKKLFKWALGRDGSEPALVGDWQKELLDVYDNWRKENNKMSKYDDILDRTRLSERDLDDIKDQAYALGRYFYKSNEKLDEVISILKDIRSELYFQRTGEPYINPLTFNPTTINTPNEFTVKFISDDTEGEK